VSAKEDTAACWEGLRFERRPSDVIVESALNLYGGAQIAQRLRKGSQNIYEPTLKLELIVEQDERSRDPSDVVMASSNNIEFVFTSTSTCTA